ncbi:flavin reductase family protein [Alkalihalobacillus sp. AL-G]|uniref:flavin reductase family protein n=1 Tax=Alkalihalobacillus sp. AL-G TaxID=2926399 RepID=UPI00272D68C6|nr:flavin reductase family protein [Alkalihalobacillus sp. AL-G]WLD94700.1 flavin reductase family protein [Alkalihalobacillus sp. AL-G]
MKKAVQIQEIKPKILYYGMPVLLLATLNEDDSTNISPMSSSWALGHYIVLGIGAGGKALENLKRHPECVINLPDPTLWETVEKLAHYTGKREIPDYKRDLGFTFEKDKFKVSGLTPLRSKTVQPDRIESCPLQIEAKVKNIRIPGYCEGLAIVETEAIHVHAHEQIIVGERHINPEKWSPLIYNFRHYFGLGKEVGKTFRAKT